MRFLLLALGLISGSLVVSCDSATSVKTQEQRIYMERVVFGIEKELQQLSEEIQALAKFNEFLLEKQDSLRPLQDPERYKLNGYYSSNSMDSVDGKSSVILLNTSPNPAQAKKDILLTNGLDSAFARLYAKYDLIEQVYSNSKWQLSRVYPPYDVVNIVDPTIDVTQFNFYYEADQEHNPSRGPVWIPEPYVDPAGRGWILSLVHPVYFQGELHSVLGIDLTVNDVIQGFLEEEKGNYIIVNKKGDIVAGKATAIEALSMPPLRNHVYLETISSDNFRISDYNLFNSKSREVRKMGQTFLMAKDHHFKFEEESFLSDAVCKSFSAIEWYLIRINDNY
ncbi:cysteine protease [Algoriphagus sp.]|uniref:cysteine protease n=1 Tax=Algoriphagus sp. TaxID=1872435 RepID=UPI0026096707|nr:cysteine protease [Algoriphagus sp.]